MLVGVGSPGLRGPPLVIRFGRSPGAKPHKGDAARTLRSVAKVTLTAQRAIPHRNQNKFQHLPSYSLSTK
jgi:hypothetical protein